jgi:uncharacterized protein with von Willebrand factor type A (vWA) domain
VSAPLLDLFYELRQRNFPLGAPDYILALRALAEGLGVGSREDLLFLCQLLWAKSHDEQREVAEALDELLPRRLSDEELEALLAGEAEAASGSNSPPALPIEEPSNEPGRKAADATRPGAGGEATAGAPVQKHGASIPTALRFMSIGTGSTHGVPLPAAGTRARWRFNPHLDFVGSLPVSRRRMKHSWRHYRRMRRVGPPVELDVSATVEDIYRRGVFVEPLLAPRRVNTARVLILVDEGGSMVPFRRAMRALLETAAQGGAPNAAVFFFHDVPGERLFLEPWLDASEPTAAVLNSFRDFGVLVIGDAGAARGNFDSARAAQTGRFISAVRRHTPHIAWLNPMPRERWVGTTAAAIVENCDVAMFEFGPAGLDSAVDVLRGR